MNTSQKRVYPVHVIDDTDTDPVQQTSVNRSRLD